MRWAFVLTLLTAVAAVAQDKVETPPARYGVNADLRRYPQTTPKETLASVLTALDKKRVDYVLAHLTDPAYVDERVKARGSFDAFVKEVRDKLADNPDAVKDLRRFLKEGEWDAAEDKASAGLKDVKDRRVHFRKIDNRWYFENRQDAKVDKKEP